MAKRCIAVDFDDVLFDFNRSFLEFHNRLHGTNVHYDEITFYEMDVVYKVPRGIISERVHAFYTSSEHAMALPIVGAQKAIIALSEEFDLHIVTARSEVLRGVTEEWIRNSFPHLFKELHFTNAFTRTPQSKVREKSEVCKEIGAELLIDDALGHARDASLAGIKVLLPDRPWNRADTPPSVVRVFSWEEKVRWIRENHT